MKPTNRLIQTFLFGLICFYATIGPVFSYSTFDIVISERDRTLFTDTTDMDSSTIWLCSNAIDFGLNDCRNVMKIIKVMRDTLIEDRLSRILGITYNNVYYPESEIVIFSKDGLMYFFEDNQWKLLYDFTANVGDTVTYHVSGKYNYYFRHAFFRAAEDRVIEGNPYQYIITKIDTIYTLSNQPIKRFYTNQIIEVGNYHSMERIVEHTGSEELLFGSNYVISGPECSYNVGIRCYSDAEFLIKFIEEDCDNLVSVDDLQMGKIKVYPNPGTDLLIVEMEDISDFYYTVHSVTGKFILAGKYPMTNVLELSTRDWEEGMYIVQVNDRKGNFKIARWVKM
ncbi:MAG: T9SS type A sorting domain-containing protein [Saprospiraceae bacterium]|nr:T9SS type A sorting domain-containing protein [Saprospiraceae bacterium]